LKDELGGTLSKFTNNIRLLREKQALTQQELADAIDRSRGYVFKLETGQRGLRPHEAHDLATVLGVPPADLLSYEDGALSPTERALIDNFRNIPDPIKRAIQQTANSFSSASKICGANPDQTTED